ncbi:hypothetical protein O3M35_010413 [Rhynocoris fuscipes]|uniref:Uncharacterized protein n=1 Tax=Rhynocoris fuscipes TaxID=488301 RepID=A0AAW1D1L4_9HEMI
MYPLVCGSVILPKLRLKDNELPNLQQMLDRVLPCSIFVMPNAKNENQNENNLHEMLELCATMNEPYKDPLEYDENMDESSDQILETCTTMREESVDLNVEPVLVDAEGRVMSDDWEKFYDYSTYSDDET